MKRLACLAVLAAAACADDAPATNPDKLWLALDGTEGQVKLVPFEPVPF